MIRLNVEVALYRRNSVLGDWPVLEVVSVSAITAAFSYLVCGSIVLLPSLFSSLNTSRSFLHGNRIFFDKNTSQSIICCSVSRPQNSCRTSFKNATPVRATIMDYASKPSSVSISSTKLDNVLALPQHGKTFFY